MSSKRPKCKRRKDGLLTAALSCLSLASSFGDSDALESITSSHVPLTPTSMAAAAAALPKVLASGRRRKRIRNNNILKSIQETTISLQGGEISRGGSDEMDTNSFLTNFQDQVSDMRKQLEDETFAKLRRLKEELRAQKSKADGSDPNASGKPQQQQQRNKRNSIPKSSPNPSGQRQQGYAEDVDDYSDGNNGNNNNYNNQDWSDYDEQQNSSMPNNNDYYNNGGDTDSDYNESIMRQPTWNEADHQAPKIIVGGGAIGVQPPGFRKTPKKQHYGHAQQQQQYQENEYGGNQYGAGAQHKRGSAQLPRHRGNHPPPGNHRTRPNNNNNINDGVIMNPYQQQQQQQQQFGYPQKAVSDKWRTATMGLLVIVLCVLASMIWNVVMGNG